MKRDNRGNTTKKQEGTEQSCDTSEMPHHCPLQHLPALSLTGMPLQHPVERMFRLLCDL